MCRVFLKLFIACPSGQDALHALREALYRIIAHLPHYFSNLSNCEQIVLFLLGTLPMALTVRQGQKESTL